MADAVGQFATAKYLNLETFRKTGMGVRTPVWFAQDVCHTDPSITVFYVYSEAEAGKVKRVRNNPNVRLTPCTVRGAVRGVWIDGRAPNLRRSRRRPRPGTASAKVWLPEEIR